MSNQFKVADAKRLIGAVQKKGLRVKSIAAAPDGTITISIAAPSRPEVSPELSREIDDLVENEWDKHVKPTPYTFKRGLIAVTISLAITSAD
jgi:hypothetical protein